MNQKVDADAEMVSNRPPAPALAAELNPALLGRGFQVITDNGELVSMEDVELWQPTRLGFWTVRRPTTACQSQLSATIERRRPTKSSGLDTNSLMAPSFVHR